MSDVEVGTLGTRTNWGAFWRTAGDLNLAWDYCASLSRATAEHAGIDFTDQRVLDVACGEQQVMVRHLWQNAAIRVGLDMDAGALAGNRSVDRVVLADIHALPFREGSFDCVVSVDTLEHSDRPDRFLGEIDRVLTAGGRALIFTPNMWGYKTVLSRLGGRLAFKLVWLLFYGRTQPYDAFYRANTIRGLRRVLEPTALRLDSFFYIAEIPHFFYRSRALNCIGYAYNRLVLALGLRWLLGYFMAVLVKE